MGDKKTMLIGLVIGIGTGLFVSGMIISILLYSSKEVEAKNHSYTLTNHVYDSPDQIYTDTKDVDNNIDTNKNMNIDTNTQINVDIDMKATDTETEDIVPSTIEITIPSNLTAKQIAKLLEEHAVVEDSDRLIEYMISKNKTRSLLHGTKIFPLNSDMESILQILISRN